MLQNVVGPILQERLGHIENDSTEHGVNLEFYVKSNTVNRRPSRIEHTLPTSSPKSTLDMWATTTSILELCRKIGIQVMPSDVNAAEKMVSSLSKQHSKSSHARASAPSLSQIFADELYQSPIARHVTDTNGHRPKLHLENNDLLFFQPQMNPKIKEAMKSNFQSALPMLHPERWWQKIPILCVENGQDINGIDVSGMLVFTANMSIKDMQKYIEDNLESKLKEYQQDLSTLNIPKQ
ncbi:hypothetical protein BGW37DRAFT_516329 [Umbelopsis sp. PMI_123]|nr:hypothetical protein BGW37DRAFT_516329 [Umbelopsis sp. PMI_123]